MNIGGVSLSFSQGKLNLKEFDHSLNREDGILKPCYSPNDLIDKLVVNFENFLEVVSAENPGKGCENILGGEKNEYVASPNRPYRPTVSTEIPPRGPQCLSSGMLEGTCPEARERLFPPAQGCGPDHLCEEGAPNPYLKNSVTPDLGGIEPVLEAWSADPSECLWQKFFPGVPAPRPLFLALSVLPEPPPTRFHPCRQPMPTEPLSE